MVKVYQALIFCVVILSISQQSQAQKLYYSEAGVVKRANLDGTGIETIVPYGTYGHNYIAVDGNNNYLFYNDTQETYRSRLDGSEATLVTDDGAFAGYTNLAVIPDYESVVYVGVFDDEDDLWLGSYYDDPGTEPVLINNGITMAGDEEYLDIAYNPSEEKIYFTGADGAVYSSSYNGAGALMIVATTNASGPIGVDYANAKVYWAEYNAGNYIIRRANLDGSSPSTVLNNANNSIESIDVYPELNAVFFSQSNGIFRMALDGTGKTQIISGTSFTNIALDFDTTPPAFYALAPTDGSTNVAIPFTLSLSFNEIVKKSNASPVTTDESSFRIYKAAGDVLVEAIDRSSSNITVTSNTVVITPTAAFEYNTDYYILAGSKVISDYTDNNWIGITLTTGWNFKTEWDPNVFYSRQNGNWNNASTWSHMGHTGPPSTFPPGTGSDVIIGNGHTVTLTGNTTAVANTTAGTTIMAGSTLNANAFDLEVWGALRIDGQLLNGGILSGMFDLYATGQIPVFDEIHYGNTGIPNSQSDIYTNAVALNGIQSINGGTINTNGYQICVPPTPPPTNPLFSNITQSSITLSWTAGGAEAFVVARAGSTGFKPQFGQAYTANATFGSGSAVGTGNYVVYSGSGSTVTITGLAPGTYYEFDLYSFTTSIGGCYSVQNYQVASATSCIVLPAPSGAVNAQYCTGDTKPSLNVNSPGSGKKIRWYDAPTGGNLVAGNDTGGDGRGGVFIPSAPSGTFYAETFDETLLCSSATRTAVTLTLHPPLTAGSPSANQNVCGGGDPTLIDGGTASGGTGAYTYTWESASAAAGPFTVIAGATAATYDPPSGITQTTYYRRITHSATCSQPGNNVTVNVIAAPVITGQPSPQQACDGQGATFTISVSGTSLTYQWQASLGGGYANISDGGVYSGATTAQLQISNSSGLNATRFQCIVTSASACPVTSDAVPLTVNQRPVVVNQSQTVCENVAGSGTAAVDLTALNGAITGGASGLSVSWYTNAALTNPVATPTAAPAINNSMFYASVLNTSSGCSASATAAITVNSKPSGTGTISGELALCTTGSSSYTVSGITNALRYQWQVTGGLQMVSQTGTSATIQALSGTSETITVTGENNCGAGGSANLTIQVLPTPVIEIIAPAEVLAGEMAGFSIQTSTPSFASILWNFGDGATAVEATPQHQYETDGDFEVSLIVQDDSQCEASEAVTIKVLPLPELKEYDIKNVITANGDSQNGFLYIQNIEKFPSNQVVLLDRWGVEVFKQDNYLNNWDARKNGDFLPAGQYVCVVKINETGKIISRTVSIIKRK